MSICLVVFLCLFARLMVWPIEPSNFQAFKTIFNFQTRLSNLYQSSSWQTLPIQLNDWFVFRPCWGAFLFPVLYLYPSKWPREKANHFSSVSHPIFPWKSIGFCPAINHLKYHSMTTGRSLPPLTGLIDVFWSQLQVQCQTFNFIVKCQIKH